MTRLHTRRASRQANRFRSRSLHVAALSLGATAVASEATATIISDLSSTTLSGQTISLDGTAFGEIELVLVGMGGMLDISLDAPVAGMMGDSSTVEFAFFSTGGMMASEYLDPLFASDTVDGSLAFTSEAFLVDNGANNPSWAPGSTAYAGFVFDPTGSLPLYGWLEITFDVSGADFSVTQWAYDDTGAGIAVGSIPEPTTALLLGFGLMSLAITARLRPRTAVSSPRG